MRPTSVDKEYTYRLILRGELDHRYRLLFGPMHMQHALGTTILTGPVRDQAELHGFLERIGELGLEILSIRQVH